MPGASSIRRTWSRRITLLSSACEPPRRMMPMLGEPEPAIVLEKPCAMARNASSTTTTSAIATTVESESHTRWPMLLRLIVVTAAICSKNERIGSAPAERGRDPQPHGIEGRDQSGNEAECEHEQDR